MTTERSSDLPLEQAVRAAADYLNQVYKTSEQGRVEEVELTDDDQYWLVTLSFILPEEERTASGGAFKFGRRQRNYKVFKIDRKSGEVRSMKIRENIHV